MQSNNASYPSVGIGILNWNGRKWLQQFLPSVFAISYPNYKVYVIDNDSSDDSIAFLLQHYPSVHIIQTGGNHGFAGGYNRGFKQMEEDYLLMLNSDVEVSVGFLEPMIALMEADKNIAVCQSRILAYNQKDSFEYGGAAGGMMDAMGYAFCRGRIFDELEKDQGQYATAEIFWATGACCLIRKQAWHKVNGMYEYFFMHFEEIDMCWRMHAKGYKLMYCNESTVYHVGGATLNYESPSKTYLNFRNNLVMVVKNSGLLYLIWWFPIRLALDMLAALQFLIKGKAKLCWAVIRAYVGLFAWLFKSVDKRHTANTSLTTIPVVYKHSIVWKYFVKGRKKFSEL